jgi:hypothetical protein
VPSASPRDALALRALTHPLRWKIIDLLGSETNATASRCAEALSESVASCSYHMGILAKYGFIEQVPGRKGREKPWRLVSPEQNLSSEGLDAESALAAEAAMAVFLDHELERLRTRLRRSDLEPEIWRPLVSGISVILTEGELRSVKTQVREILSRYEGRTDAAALRSSGARETRLFFAISAAPSVSAPSHTASQSQELPLNT